MGKFFVILLGLLCQSTAIAEWGVKEKVDSMTDETRKSAYVVNEQGHSFSIYRIANNGAVWANFSISENSFDQIDFKTPPTFRVDKYTPADLGDAKKVQAMGIQAYEWEPKWVNFLVWHGKGESIGKNLIPIMSGNSMVFRYYLSTGGYKETTFSLEGANRAISTAIGISYEPNQDEILKNQIADMLSSYEKACQQEINKKCADGSLDCRGKNRMSDEWYSASHGCYMRAKDCHDEAIKALDISVFKKCMN